MKQIFKPGDIIYVDCEPQAGHEQKGRRPALVTSNCVFNKYTQCMALVCPITNTNRNSPLRVKIPEGKCKVSGYIMLDQVRTMDIIARNAVWYDKVPDDIVDTVRDIICEIVE